MKSKSLRTAVDQLREGTVEPVYFLNGDDYFLQTLFVDEVTKALATDQPPEKSFLATESVDYASVVADLSTGSLFGGRKLTILHNPPRTSSKARDDFLAYLRAANREHCLVVIQDKVERRSAFFKQLSAVVAPVNTSSPFPDKMAGWISFLMKRSGLTASGNAIDLLLELSGDSLYHIANDIEKIKIGLPEGANIEAHHVQSFCGWKRKFFPWNLSDAVGERDLNRSILIGRSLVTHGVEVTSLIAQLATLFQELLLMSLPQGEEGAGPRTGWLNKILTRKLPSYVNNFSKDELERSVKALGQADRDIKTGRSSGEAVLIPLLHRIAGGHG